jgi:hypothetical protein
MNYKVIMVFESGYVHAVNMFAANRKGAALQALAALEIDREAVVSITIVYSG